MLTHAHIHNISERLSTNLKITHTLAVLSLSLQIPADTSRAREQRKYRCACMRPCSPTAHTQRYFAIFRSSSPNSIVVCATVAPSAGTCDRVRTSRAAYGWRAVPQPRCGAARVYVDKIERAKRNRGAMAAITTVFLYNNQSWSWM